MAQEPAQAAGSHDPVRRHSGTWRELTRCRENEKAFTDAVYLDLNRPAFETITAETNAIKAEVNEAIAHLAGWAKPQGVKTSLIWSVP